MSNDKLFEEYLGEKKGGFPGFFRNPRSWILLVSILVAVILLAYFFKSVILEGMTGEEVKKSIEIVWYDTRWVDKKVTPQEVKIVPSISLKIKNVGKRTLQYVDIEAVFEFEESGAVFDDGMARFLQEPLEPGEISERIFIKSSYGYSASSRAAFLKNKEKWKKMQAKIFARAKGSGLVRIGDIYPVKQEIEGYEDELMLQEEEQEDYQNEHTRKLAYSIRVVEQDSMWVEKVAAAKEVIIVPSITFKIKNVGQEPLQYIYFRGVFKYEDTGEIMSEGLAPALEKELPPGETSGPIQVKADFGYAASSKEAFFKNPGEWKKLKVDVLAKSKESEYVLLGIYPIKQEIQGVKVIYHQPRHP
jgi:hypothetical protein